MQIIEITQIIARLMSFGNVMLCSLKILFIGFQSVDAVAERHLIDATIQLLGTKCALLDSNEC